MDEKADEAEESERRHPESTLDAEERQCAFRVFIGGMDCGEMFEAVAEASAEAFAANSLLPPADDTVEQAEDA